MISNIRLYSLKYEKSIIGYKQMPDLFYNAKRKKLPLRIYTAIVNTKNTLSDRMLTYLMSYQYKYDMTFPNLLNKFQMRRLQKIKSQQMIPSEVIDEVGVELSVAHLVLRLGGAIRLSGADQWIGHIKECRHLLPTTRIRDFHIEAIDLTGTLITYEGLEYLPSLHSLRELRLNTTAFLDDHCLRRISRMRKKLELLDISNCPQISGKGLSTLWNLQSLKMLNVAQNPLLEDKELVCILLQEKIPLLQIQGVDYLGALNNRQKEEILQLYSQQQRQLQNRDDVKDDNEEAKKLRCSDV